MCMLMSGRCTVHTDVNTVTNTRKSMPAVHPVVLVVVVVAVAVIVVVVV